MEVKPAKAEAVEKREVAPRGDNRAERKAQEEKVADERNEEKADERRELAEA